MSKGRATVITLKEVDEFGNPTGRTKPNVIGDPDYIPPIYTDECGDDDTTTTTTSTSTTSTTTFGPFSVVNNTGIILNFKTYGPDGVTVVTNGIIPVGGTLFLNFFSSSKQYVRIIAPQTGNYHSTIGSYDNAVDLIANDIIVTFTPAIIDQMEHDYHANIYYIGFIGTTTTTTTTTSSTTTTTSTSTTTSTTLPPLFLPLRYVSHAIAGGATMSGNINISGNVGGVPVSIKDEDAALVISETVNSPSNKPVIDNFWLTSNITNPTIDDYAMVIQVDGVQVDGVNITAGATINRRTPLTGNMEGSQIDIFFTKTEEVPTIEWEGIDGSCELIWDGEGTTSTTTAIPAIQIATVTTNMTVFEFATPPLFNAQATVSLSAPAPFNMVFIVQQFIQGGDELEVDVAIAAGQTTGTTNFFTGASGVTPSMSSIPFDGVPCVIGYRSTSPITIDYNNKGCKATVNSAEIIGTKQIGITINTYNDTDVLLDTINYPIGVGTVERIIIAAVGYFTIDFVSYEPVSVIADLYLNNVFEDYFTIASGESRLGIRIPNAGTDTNKNIKITLT